MITKKIISKYKSLPVQVRASLWFLACSFLQKAISVITTPIFTRLISTQEYGQYNIFNSWYGIASIIVSINLSYGVYSQGLIKFQEDKEVFSSSLQGLTFTLCLVWTLIYLIFHDFWNTLLSLTTEQMLFMLSMIWTSAVFGFWITEQRVNYSYQKLVIVTLLSSVLMPAVEILLVLNMQDKVMARIIGIAVVQAVMYIWMFVYQLRRGGKFYSERFWRYALVYNIPLIPHYLSQILLNNSDRIMIGKLVGDSQAGIYSLAYSVALIMTLFNTALLQTITPWIYQKIKEKRECDIAPIAYLTLAIIGIVNVLLILFAPEVVSIFAPDSYHEAIWIIPPVALSVFFMYTYDLFAKFAFYYEKTKFVMGASVVGALVNIILNYIFIKLYGYIAAGYTTLACYVLYSILHYVFMKKVCRDCCEGRYPYKTSILLWMSVIFCAIGFLLLLTYEFPTIRYTLAICLAIIACLKRTFIKKKLIAVWSIRR